MTKVTDIKAEWTKYMVIKDPFIIDVTLATVLGNALIQRDPLWIVIVAPSSGGKSTYIAPLSGIPTIFFCDDLTSKSFLSGYKLKGKEVSLLKIIGSGMMCFSDLTSILSKNPLERNEILGQLRLVYDGKFNKRTGTGEIAWQGKIGVLAACTPDIYYILESARSMGERMAYFWLDQPTDEEIIQKQREVNMSSREIADIMHPLYRDYIEGIKAFVAENGVPPLSITLEQEAEIAAAATFCVNAKATVHLDYKTGKPDALVSKPGVGRDRKMFQTLLHALQLMEAYETDNLNAVVTAAHVHIVKKCAWSSVSRERRKVLEILTAYDKPMSASEIGATDDFGLQKEGVERYLWALHAVGIIQKHVDGNSHKWSVKEDKIKNFIRSMTGVTEVKELVLTPEQEADRTFDEYDPSKF